MNARGMACMVCKHGALNQIRGILVRADGNMVSVTKVKELRAKGAVVTNAHWLVLTLRIALQRVDEQRVGCGTTTATDGPPCALPLLALLDWT